MEQKKKTYYTEARARANKKYLSQFADVRIRMTPEMRAAVQAHAAEQGESMNAFTLRAIAQAMEQDKAKAGQDGNT